MKNLALFDFDGTLYNKDSLLEFTKYSRGNITFYFGMILLSPYLVLMKLGILSNEKVKIKYFKYFFKNCKYKHFKVIAKDFSLYEIEKNLDLKILENFKNHIKSKDKIYIVTASIPDWILPWSAKFNVKVLGTELEIIDGKITGNFATKNCFGKEKVNRIKASINLDNFENIYVYGSGKGDLEMLQLSKKTI